MAVKRKRSTTSTDGASSQSGSRVNGVQQSSRSKSKAPASSSQADWVDYRVKYPQARKARRASDEFPSQSHPYKKGQEQLYEILPRTWNDLGRYKKFRLMEETGESMGIGDVVLVNHDNGQAADGEIDLFKQWKALVLEIRAKDAQHVYLRVYWVYDPEELPGGRRPYHGEYELVPSNDMAIVDAMTINGRVRVTKWNEYDDDEDPDTGTEENPGFYWRQMYNVHTRQLSQLRQHCVCSAPVNPDHLLVQCTDKLTCGRWLHSECIEEKAIQKVISAISSNTDTDSSPSKKQRSANAAPTKLSASPNKGKKRKLGVNEEESSPFAADIVAVPGKKGHRLEIRDLRKGHDGEDWEERIYCLCCSSLLGDEGEDQSQPEDGVAKDPAEHGEATGADEITVQGKASNGTEKGAVSIPEARDNVDASTKIEKADIKDGIVNGQAANAPSPSKSIIGSITTSLFGNGT